MNHHLKSLLIYAATSFLLTATADTISATDLYSVMHRRMAGLGLHRAPGESRRVPRQAYPTLDICRQVLGVDRICSEAPRDVIPFSGKDVVIGIIDGGIDPRHVTFDASRVKRYVRTASSLESESGTLETVEYDDISRLTDTDIDTGCEGHGTHVAGIAAGSGAGTPYAGIAPEAELVMVSLGEKLYEDEIEYGLRYVLNYATEVGKPAVLNFSLGSPVGNHRGRNPLTECIADYSPAGHAVLFSAGNDGNRPVSITRDFTAEPGELATWFSKTDSGTAAEGAYVEVYAEDEREVEIAFSAMSFPYPYSEVWRSDFLTDSDFDEQGICVVLNSESGICLLPGLDKYLFGTLVVGREIDVDGNYHLMLLADFPENKDMEPFTLGMRLRSPQGAKIMAIADLSRSYMRSYGMSGYTNADASCSISDYCTSPRVISVGAWNARESWTDAAGEYHELATDYYGEAGGVARYSSYGESLDGEHRALPHLLAPGTEVISSLGHNTTAQRVVSGETGSEWGLMTGTSMATPAAAGVVALWLQACPSLTRDEILEVMRATCVSDESVQKACNAGECGKLDAYAGLRYILSHLSTPSNSIPSEHRLTIRHLGQGKAECLVPFATSGGDAMVYSADGNLLSRHTFHGNTFEVTGQTGIYIIKVISAQGTACGRVMLL